jgi:uncharacterized Zn-finger protein
MLYIIILLDTVVICVITLHILELLEQHSKAVHLGKNDYKCDICDKAFSWKGHLTRHINRIHKNLKNYSCELCNYTSYTNRDLKKHLIVYHVDKNVECNNLETHNLLKEAQKDQMFVLVEKITIFKSEVPKLNFRIKHIIKL